MSTESHGGTLLPIFVKLDDKPVLVVGGGALAENRIEPLLLAGARVQVVAQSATEQLITWSLTGAVTWRRRPFRAADVAGKAIVFAATGSPTVDGQVFAACRRWGVLCNAIDDPRHCDFYTSAVVRRGDLQIAISTNGQSPALAQHVRRELEGKFGPEWTQRIRELGRERRQVLSSLPAGESRNRLLHERARAALADSEARDRVVRT